jgi:plasmid stability protein
LDDDQTDALRARAALGGRSSEDVVRQAVREYLENHARTDDLEQVLDEELPRYREALDRLGQ